MKQGKTIAVLLTLLLSGEMLMAQTGNSGSDYLLYGLLAVVALVFFGIIIQVSDNMLAIEARRIGAVKEGEDFSLYPRRSEFMASRLPEYLSGKPVVKLNRGHDILLEGEAPKSVNPKIQAHTYAVKPTDFIGMAPIPKVVVEVGASVKAGDPLFFDKNRPEIQYVAPVSGEIVAVNRGEKRSIADVVILADKEQKYRKLPAFDLAKATREELVQFLVDAGAWPLIRQRPFNIVPETDSVPANIFISTFDSAPLAPDLNFVVEGREAAFQQGLDLLGKLTTGRVYLGLDGRGDKAPAAAFTEAKGVEVRYFRGKHPAGNVGIQIHHVAPVSGNRKAWTLNVQDVITLGALITEGRYNAERLVALTGAELNAPTYVRTHQGAKIGDLLSGQIKGDNVRIISGDVLSGQQVDMDGYLGFYDDQVTVVKEGNDFEMFGWLLPSSLRPTISNTFPNFLFPSAHFEAETNTHGEKRAFVVTGEYEKVLPMDILPQHLFKNILIGDIERMEGLGLLELVEEDVALCEFACTSKQPLQLLLREGLEKLRAES